jgi:tRNA (mo5U34)-methyltransferase
MEDLQLDAQELQDRIAAFTVWPYEFEFEDGIRTHVPDPGRVNRQHERRLCFFDPLLSLTGGTLRGRRVLDLGCSAGWFSLLAIESGADFVLGVDGSPTAVEQANLVFEASGVDRERYRFDEANLFDYGLEGSFDVVLCLGLLSVVAQPVALFELMARSGAKLLVIDTGLAPTSRERFEMSRLAEPRNAIDHDLVLVPSRAAVERLAATFGFEIVALAHRIGDPSGMEDYAGGRRMAFICSRGPSLASLPAAPAQPGGPLRSTLDSAGRGLVRRLRG